MAKANWIIETPTQAPETLPQHAARVGTTTGVNLLSQLGDIIGLGAREAVRGVTAPLAPLQALNLFGANLPTPESLSSQVPMFGQVAKEKIAQQLPPEYLEPQNVLERGLQRFVSSAPGAALTGGLNALPGTALGAATGALAGAAGAPEVVQDIAQFIPELGYAALKGKLPTIQKTKKLEDSLARAAVSPGTQESIGALGDALRTVEESLSTEVDQTLANKIKDTLGTLYENISKKKINPVVAMDLRKKLYSLGNKLPDDKAAEYIQPLTKGINEFFSAYAAKNPYFYEHLNARDKLTALSNMNLMLPNLVNKLQLNKIPGGQFASDMVNKILGETERFVRGVSTNKPAAKYYLSALSSGIEQNPALFTKNISKVAQEMPEFFKEEVSKPETEWIIE